MCGRFARFTPTAELAELLDARVRDELPPRYNIAPTQNVLAMRLDEDGKRCLSALRWGLIPFWAEDQTIGNRMINARAESVHEKPAFRRAFRRRRCLIPADGFYEWQKTGGKKQPYFIRMADGQPLCFAGLWETWTDPEGEPLESCTILTTDANDDLHPIHHRMPVILLPDRYDPWLDPAARDPTLLRDYLKPLPAGLLAAYPVGTYVNNVRNDDPRCAEPVER